MLLAMRWLVSAANPASLGRRSPGGGAARGGDGMGSAGGPGGRLGPAGRGSGLWVLPCGGAPPAAPFGAAGGGGGADSPFSSPGPGGGRHNDGLATPRRWY